MVLAMDRVLGKRLIIMVKQEDSKDKLKQMAVKVATATKQVKEALLLAAISRQMLKKNSRVFMGILYSQLRVQERLNVQSQV